MKKGAISESLSQPEAGTSKPKATRVHATNLAGTALGKLTSTSVKPLAVIGEIVFLPLIAVVLGFTLNPEDPLWVKADFPWSWFAPIILALRYGPLAGLGASGMLLGAWLLLNVGQYDSFPKLSFLGGLILIMLVGEFSSLWLARTRRAETVQVYLDQRLDHLTRQYYLLRLSHDRLEQDLISRPMSMRDALRTLRDLGRETDDPGASAQSLLHLLAQYCQLESAAVFRTSEGRLSDEPLAEIGNPQKLDQDDPLIRQAIDSRHLCHISQSLASEQSQTRYLIAAPLINLNGEIYGLLAVEQMPFFALQEESLQTINLLLGYFTDGLSVHSLGEPLCREFPLCPPEFAFEMQRLWHLRQSTGIASIIVALTFLPRSVERDHPLQIMRMKRSMDELWLLGSHDRQMVAVLMPLGNAATAEGYVARLETWAQQQAQQTLDELGIFPHIIQLDRDAPLTVMRRLSALSHD